MNENSRPWSSIRSYREIGILTAAIIIVVLNYRCIRTPVEANDTIEVIEKYSELDSTINSDPNQIWVINFWATTCPPCLKEMPHFKELNEEFQRKNVRILLVSLDMVRHLEERVYPFVEKHNIVPEVVLLADQNYSDWTDEIDPSWFGALPATIIIGNGNRKFRFGMYESYEQLSQDVDEIINL